jgi:hypothetical protein
LERKHLKEIISRWKEHKAQHKEEEENQPDIDEDMYASDPEVADSKVEEKEEEEEKEDDASAEENTTLTNAQPVPPK